MPCPQDWFLPDFFLGATPTDCGNDRDAEKLRRRMFPFFFCPNAERL
ncbi:hypothetical protein [Oscillospiraceae bacterium]|nr:hypothetical protein [Oscillospiraceae bacterium]